MVLGKGAKRNIRKAWTAITKRHWYIGMIRQTMFDTIPTY